MCVCVCVCVYTLHIVMLEPLLMSILCVCFVKFLSISMYIMCVILCYLFSALSRWVGDLQFPLLLLYVNGLLLSTLQSLSPNKVAFNHHTYTASSTVHKTTSATTLVHTIIQVQLLHYCCPTKHCSV